MSQNDTDLRPCWIYVISHVVSENMYIGISVNPKRRWTEHKRCARRGDDTRFYNALRAHGAENFEFSLIEQVDSPTAAKIKEIILIAALQPEYNTTAGGDGMFNPPEEVRKKMSERIKNSPKAVGRLERAWVTRRANTTPEEWSKIMSDAQANMTPEQKAQKSRKLSEAQANRSSEAEAERQRKRAETVANWTEEQKQSYSQKITHHNLTRVLTEEAQQRIAEGQVTGGHLTGQLMKERLAEMSEEDKKARMDNIVKGIKAAAKNRTQEEKDAITRKRLASRERNKAARLASESKQSSV